jgi:lipoate-protein ligase A
MHFCDVTLGSLPENLALDEALLLQAEAGQGGEVLRFWEWPSPAVILGAAGCLAEDVDEAACRTGQVPILRRSSGGGTVLLGAGCLLYSLVLRYDTVPALSQIRSSYCYIFERIRTALLDAVPGLTIAGTSDLAIDGRKFSGNAQQRKRQHLLHHGSLLYGFDLQQVGRYLRQPLRQPAYRRDRSHAEFLTNLPLGPDEIKNRLRVAWHAGFIASKLQGDLVRQLVETKYSTETWTRRR